MSSNLRFKKELIQDFLVSSSNLIKSEYLAEIVTNLENSIDKFNLQNSNTSLQDSRNPLRTTSPSVSSLDGAPLPSVSSVDFSSDNPSVKDNNKPCEKCHQRKPKGKVKLGELYLFLCKQCIESTQKRFQVGQIENSKYL